MGKDVGIAFPHRGFYRGSSAMHVTAPGETMLGPELNKTAPVTKAEESFCEEWCEEPH